MLKVNMEIHLFITHHKEVINKKLLHGIEVVNFDTFSEEAMQIALENELTMMGTSDVHILIAWDFNIEKESYHRPITFIMSENQTIKSIRDALFTGNTFIWYRDLIIGKSKNFFICSTPVNILITYVFNYNTCSNIY